MALPTSKNVIIRFGPFEANLSTQELLKFGTRLRLPNQSFQILVLLLERPGQLVTRDELRQKLWPSDTFVEYDQGLNAAVNRLRDALGDSADKPRYIETLPRRGYRFLAKTENVRENHEEVPVIDNGQPPSPSVASSIEPENRMAAAVPVTKRKSAGKASAFSRTAFGVAGLVIFISALLLTTIVLWLKTRPGEPNFSSTVVTPFTSLPGQEVSPTFSPDGSQIAFAWSSNLNKGFDLYVKTIGSERMIKLTDHPSHWISPAWSPDGTQIAFARRSESDSGIFAVPALGGPERKLADATFWYKPFMQISWSPDSKSLAYWSIGERGSHIFLLDLDTLRSRVMNPDLHCWDMASPSFSPDGTKLAFVCTSSIAVYAIFEVPLTAGSPRRLVSMMGYFRGLTWSADARRIIVSNDSGDGGSLWQVDLDGRVHKLPFGEEGTDPSAAGRGNKLAYVRGSQIVDIWRLDLRAEHPEKSATKLIYSTRIQRVPQYSPDGNKIVFESDRSGTHEVWLADADGSNLVRLTSFNGPQTGSPSWCSDGHRIAFDSRASGSSAIYVEEIDKQVPKQLNTDVQNLALPAWSEGCQWLFASDGHQNLYRIPSQGGAASRISDKGSWFSVVRNGRVFFNVNEGNKIAIWSRSVIGGEAEPLKGMPALNAAESWTATEHGIYYTSSSPEPAAINFYNFATRTLRRLCSLPQSPTPGGGVSVTTDGRSLLYAQTDDTQSDIMLATHFQ
jgi:Tol biopolymer transport system component/DNA-binding winged helix-turn-helix (wHTH) protein